MTGNTGSVQEAINSAVECDVVGCAYRVPAGGGMCARCFMAKMLTDSGDAYKGVRVVWDDERKRNVLKIEEE